MLIQITISGLLTLFLIVLIRKYAHQLLLLDKPNHRSIHTNLIPRGAGIAFTIGAIIALYIGDPYFLHHRRYTILAILFVLAIGILDDRHRAKPKTKFIVLFLTTILIWQNGLRIDNVGIYFGFDIHFAWLAFPFTYFAIAGFTNAMNLIDGLDGLAGSISLLILTFFFYLGYQNSDKFLMELSLVFIVGLVVFLFFNWNPASIFMGDSGSLTLGFLISLLSFHTLRYIPSVAILYIGAYPIIDTIIAIIRRKREGVPITRADRCHIHHILLNIIGSVKKTVVLISTFQAIFIFIALLIHKDRDQGIFLLLYVIVVAVIYNIIIFFMRNSEMGCHNR